MRPMKVGVFSESSRNKGLGRNRFDGDTDITAKDEGRTGKNKVGKYSGDIHRRIVKHVR